MQVLDRQNFRATTVRLAAAGDWVMVYSELGQLGPSYWVSNDGGRTFTRTKGSFNVLAVGVEPDSAVWSFGQDAAGLSFRSSSDGAMTFTPGPSFPFDNDFFAFAAGPKLLYEAGKELRVVPRDGSAALETLGALPPFHPGSQPGLVVDRKDNVVVLTLLEGQAQAHRLNAGQTTFAAAKVLGPSVTGPGAVALSDRAIAVALSIEGRLSVAVETWP
jgi:hypothetical protein